MQLSQFSKSMSLRAKRGNLIVPRHKLSDCHAIARNDIQYNHQKQLNHQKQQGVSIVIAIFLITAMALLATAAVQLVATGQQSLSQEITSVKAYFAGQTGLQWGMYQAVYATPSSTHTITLSNGGLSSTSAAMTFSSKSIDGNTYYDITSLGEYSTSASAEYSSRELILRFKP